MSTTLARADELPPAPPVVPGVVMPDARGKSGLLADVRRIVEAEGATGWFLDRTHFDAMKPALLQSVCRSTAGARAGALAELEAERARAGAPAAAFEAAGRTWDEAATRAARVDREVRALAAAIGSIADCPYWISPQIAFDGRQTDRNRATFNLETGGLLQLRHTAGTWTYGGGGVIRALAGWGFGGRFTLLAGPEFAGGAMLQPGPAPSQFVVNYFPALPVIARFHDGGWHYDLEVAPVALFQAEDFSWSFGGRIGAGFGVSALRTRYFIPWAGIGAAYEHYVESGGRPAADFFRAGLRVGIILDGR
jgi:hypothetical protein